MPPTRALEALADQPDITGALLSRLPLTAFAALAQTCPSLRGLIWQQPEHPWLAQAHHYLPSHPLKQASSTRAYLAQQRSVHSNVVSGRCRLQTVATSAGIVSALLHRLPAPGTVQPLTPAACVQASPDFRQHAALAGDRDNWQLHFTDLASGALLRSVALPRGLMLPGKAPSKWLPASAWGWEPGVHQGGSVSLPYGPAWSPEVATLPYEAGLGISAWILPTGIVFVDSSTGACEVLALPQQPDGSEGVNMLGWSPTGLLLLRYIDKDGEGVFAAYNAKGQLAASLNAPKQLQRFVPGAHLWSPDGQAVVFAGRFGNEVWLWRLDRAVQRFRSQSRTWMSVGWDPLSQTVMLSSPADLVFLGARQGVCKTAAKHPPMWGAVWAGRGRFAVPSMMLDQLHLYALQPEQRQPSHLRSVTLPPGYTLNSGGFASTRQQLAVSYDGAHIVAAVAQGDFQLATDPAAAVIDCETGCAHVYPLGLPGRAGEVFVSWSPDATSALAWCPARTASTTCCCTLAERVLSRLGDLGADTQ